MQTRSAFHAPTEQLMPNSTDSRACQPINVRTAVVLLVCCLATGLIGCRTVRASMLDVSDHSSDEPLVSTVAGADHSSIEKMTDSRWPMRWGDDPARRGVIIELDRPWAQFRSAHLGRHSNMRISEIEYADAEVLGGALGMETGFKFKAEGPGAFLFVPRVEPADKPNTKPEPDMAFKFVSARLVKGDSDEDSVRLERTWFTYRQPRDPESMIGTAVILPGIFGTPIPVIDGLETYLRAKGWATLRMMSHPSGFTGHPDQC
jgi:hypothetical protein